MCKLDEVKDYMSINPCFGYVKKKFLKGLSYQFQQTSWNLACTIIESCGTLRLISTQCLTKLSQVPNL